jgi:hypothetical protein
MHVNRAPVFLLAMLLAPAFAQTDRVDLVSDKPGHAEARVFGLVLRAEEAKLNPETGELVMRGHVHAILPAREDHTVVRYGAGVLLTQQPIGLAADRVTVKSGVLQASGNIVLLPMDEELPRVQLRGDELSMFLKIGDATLRGNLRPTGLPVQSPTRGPFTHIFPPDIIK